MKTKISTLILACVLSIISGAYGQQRFSEGLISYGVTIDPPAGEGLRPEAPVAGEFNITLKGNQYIKELQLSSGFRNLIIFNLDDNTAYSLRYIQDKKFAIQLDAAELLKKQQSCDQYKTAPLSNCPGLGKMTAGFQASCIQILCSAREPMTLYYTKEWQVPGTYLFQYFPSFEYLPLSYDIKNEDGSVMHFVLKKIEARPIDNGTFRVPASYRIITNEEYRQMIR